MIRLDYYSEETENVYVEIASQKFIYILNKYIKSKRRSKKYKKIYKYFFTSGGDIDTSKVNDLILMKPYEIRKIIDELGELKNDKLLKKAFSNLTSEYHDCVDNLAEKNGLYTCPYCNAKFVFSNNGSKRIRYHFDHFFPVSDYPYLCVCLYNLIPSCSECNSLKSNEINKHLLSPFEYGFDKKIRFSLKTNNSIFGLFNGEFSIVLKYSNNVDPTVLSAAVENETFMLTEYYNHFIDYVCDIVFDRIVL